MEKTSVTIVNDCSYVMANLIPHIKNYSINFIGRTRGLWSKTVALTLKISKAKSDLYHVNYALQDAFLVDKIKHLDILHCHGSDVRWVIHSKRWGWLVRRNLQNAKKVLCSTPDLVYLLEDYNAVWLPNPVDTEKFKPLHFPHSQPKAVYFAKWYEKLPEEVIRCCKKNGIHLTIIPFGLNLPYKFMPKFLSAFDILIDRFRIRSFSKTALEAFSCGLVRVPVYEESISESLRKYSSLDYCHKQGLKNREYILRQHEASLIANKLQKIWKELEP